MKRRRGMYVQKQQRRASWLLAIAKRLEWAVGKVKAGQGWDLTQHGLRFARKAQKPQQLTTAREVAAYLLERIYTPLEVFVQEEVWVLLLDARGKVVYEVLVYRGTLEQVQIRPAEILRAAVILNTPQLIMAHNHPSGDPQPSPEDKTVTRMASQAAELLGIRLLDHLVIGNGKWVSFREQGMFL